MPDYPALICAAASLEEAGDLYIEARGALNRASQAWHAVADAMGDAYARSPSPAIVPLVVFS